MKCPCCGENRVNVVDWKCNYCEFSFDKYHMKLIGRDDKLTKALENILKLALSHKIKVRDDIVYKIQNALEVNK